MANVYTGICSIWFISKRINFLKWGSDSNVVKIISLDFGPLEIINPAKHDPTEVGFNSYPNLSH